MNQDDLGVGGSGLSQDNGQTNSRSSTSQSSSTKSTEMRSSGTSAGTGGAGQEGATTTGESAEGMTPGEVSGRVVKRQGDKLVYIEHLGAVVPVKIDSKTKFEDPSLRRAKDLKEGQEIRAQVEVKGTDNVAKSITTNTANPGTGGSSYEGSTPSHGSDLPGQQPGTGGSGTLNPDDSINQSTTPMNSGDSQSPRGGF